ncbi:MAG: CD1871A family CXXC motif-containing protein [Atopobium sp.]|nr:CD1871A family CXXC motif-containing protein [Atopobium sp.]
MKSKQACGWNCRLRVLPILFLLLGCAFVVYGASRGEVSAVLGKAVRICLECVGIG